MTVQDIMETYQYNDAAEFTEFLQTSILESYSKPETIAVFVDLAASKGSSTITQDTLDVMNVEGVTFTEPEVSRVLSGTPTSAPTTEEKPLSLFEKIMKDKIRFSFSIVGFVLLCLCVVWIIYRHRRQKKTEMDQTEEDYKNKLKNTENNNSLFINVKFGDDNYNDDKVDEVKEGNLVKEKIIDEKAVLSLSKFDSMMNKSFKGFVTEVDDVAPPSPSPLRSTMSKTPRMKIKKVKSPPLTESKSNFNTPSLRAYEAFKLNSRTAMAHSAEALDTSRVASFSKSMRWDTHQTQKSTLSPSRPKPPTKAFGQSVGKHKYRPKSLAFGRKTARPTSPSSPKSNMKRSALSQKSLFRDANPVSLKQLSQSSFKTSGEGEGGGRERTPPRSVRQTTWLPGATTGDPFLRTRNKTPAVAVNSRLTFQEAKRSSELSGSKDRVHSRNITLPFSDNNDDWDERYSERKQRPYWKNRVTGASTWKNPTYVGGEVTHHPRPGGGAAEGKSAPRDGIRMNTAEGMHLLPPPLVAAGTVTTATSSVNNPGTGWTKTKKSESFHSQDSAQSAKSRQHILTSLL